MSEYDIPLHIATVCNGRHNSVVMMELILKQTAHSKLSSATEKNSTVPHGWRNRQIQMMYSMDPMFKIWKSVSNISSLGISGCTIYQIEKITQILKTKYSTFRPSFMDYSTPVHM